MQFTMQHQTQTRHIPFTAGDSILCALQAAGVTALHAPCGGHGRCGKCKVTVTTPQGERTLLACQTKAEEGMTVTLPQTAPLDVTQTGACRLYHTDGEAGYALACDIGTTTVVCHLLRLSDGARLATRSGANPQSAWGADVIARISACADGKLDAQKAAIRSQLRGFLQELCGEAGIHPGAVRRLTVVGNTVMCHLFAGLNPETIGVAPFEPLSRFGAELGLGADLGLSCPVWVAPCVSGYVGGDITAGLLAAGLAEEEKPCLYLDVGTNGEMALGRGRDFLCCATAAGPAFEGAEIELGMSAAPGAVTSVDWAEGRVVLETIADAPPVGICGSGLMDALALLLNLGVVDESGRMEDREDLPERLRPYVTDDRRFLLTPDGAVYLTQGDIRKLQLAKAAIAAGMTLLLREAGLETRDLGALVLAGGFGSHLRPESAARIGLILPGLLEKTRAVGNAAGEGAVSAALSRKARGDMITLRDCCRYLELSSHKGFSPVFVDALLFE